MLNSGGVFPPFLQSFRVFTFGEKFTFENLIGMAYKFNLVGAYFTGIRLGKPCHYMKNIK
jgi:hypothetical protein